MKTQALAKRLLLVLCGVLAAVLLVRWQRIFYLECADYIRSDMPAHVALALGHNDYGLCSFLIRALWSALGEHRAETALSLLLTVNQALGIAAVWLFVRRLLPELDAAPALLAAILAHLCGPWIVPGQTEMYLGAYNGNIFHNMTVLFSRTFIPLDLLLFFKLWEDRREKLDAKRSLGLALCLLLTTLLKPSFFVAFAPTALAMLAWDFCATRAKGLGREIGIGLAFIPAALALGWSYLALFGQDFAGESSSMALRALTLGTLLSMGLVYLRGLLLPLWSAALFGRRDVRCRIFAAVNAVAIAEAVLLTETGFRANDGNMDWGALSLYPTVFALAIGRLLGALVRKEAKPWQRAVGGVLLLGHLLVGLYCLWRPGHAGYDWFYF